MMNIQMLKAAVAGLVLSVSGFANAGLIVDTGSNAAGTAWSWGSGQNFSGIFTTISDWNINSIEAFVSNNGSEGDIDLAIWSSSGNTPLEVLFSSTGTIAANAASGWYGVSGLNEFLSAGTYWVSAAPGVGVYGVQNGGAPNPLDAYNQRQTGQDWQWDFANPGQHLAIGFKIGASEVNSVPEPSTLAIFALGIMGLAARRLKKQ